MKDETTNSFRKSARSVVLKMKTMNKLKKREIILTRSFLVIMYFPKKIGYSLKSSKVIFNILNNTTSKAQYKLRTCNTCLADNWTMEV